MRDDCMKLFVGITLGLLFSTILAQAEDRFFECVFEDGGRQEIAVAIGETDALGCFTQAAESGHATGTFYGEKLKDGSYRVIHNFTVDGSSMSEEMRFRLKGGNLLMGVGELQEGPDGIMVLKNPAKLDYSRVFKPVPLANVSLTEPEGRKILAPLEKRLSKVLETPVGLQTGNLMVADGWAVFEGYVTALPTDKPISEATSDTIGRMVLRTFFKQDDDGSWSIEEVALMNNEGQFEFEKDFSGVPWQLLQGIQLAAMKESGC